ncbi:cache domain-containing protein [Sporomusa malonica]|uniref:Circadian input-output histidine kinase CikA n=1 Tax=Sporomusa malonica TaxID=112901 RepID=A0A1W1ZTS8_9FIRM|nr:cache domain-containing protein [Sporomusa malonica]SMC51804.1 Response regulator receiver domain-containing protein [Sporomusa malonica]
MTNSHSFGIYSIRWRFIISISLAVVLGLCMTILWTTEQIRQEAELVAMEKVRGDLNLTEALLHSRYPGPWAIRDGKLYKGATLINEDFVFVDEVGQQTGDTCSIFQGDTRVATNIMRAEKRVIGTKVSAEVSQIVLGEGQEFLGEADVVGVKYQAAYRPLRDETGKIIGIWYVGADKSFVDKITGDAIRSVTKSFLLGWFVILAVIWLLTSSLIRPVKLLVSAANRLAVGDLDTEITAHSKDEIGYLSKTFEQMRQKLRLHNQNLEDLVSERTFELKQAYAELKQLDEMKSSFLSTVSHELRTPLTSVLGFARIIQKKLETVILPQITTDDLKVTKAMQQINGNINIIVAEGERLTDLINDVLDLAKMEAGKVNWKIEPQAIKDIITRAVNSTEFLVSQKGLTIITEIQSDLPPVPADRDRLIQVLINLISNAVKFTAEGSITCRAVKTADGVLVTVSDPGIGIAKEDQQTVFEKFKQIGDTLTEKPRGTGLGLPICRQIIEHHSGRIWVESQPDQGSSFCFTLPVSPQANRELSSINRDLLLYQVKCHTRDSKRGDESAKNILVIDDEANIRTLLRQELEASDYTVQEASDGLQALERIYHTLRTDRTTPDLIILDVMMPKMSGFDVAAILKNNPDTMHIPIVMLSIIEDQQRGYSIGVDRYLTKPVNIEVLLSEIKSLLSLESHRKNILVVDDDQTLLQHLTQSLAASGYIVFSTDDSDDCIKRAKSLMPDIIIIDSRFSEQHGILRSLRFEKGFENVFFLLLGNTTERKDSG